MNRVLIVDDHVAVCEGLRAMIAAAFPGVQIEAAPDPPAGMKMLASGPFDLIILDLGFRGRTWLDAIGQFKLMQPAARILVYTMQQEINFGVRSIGAGADGYLTKECPAEEVLRAIRMVASGQRYINAALADALADFVASQRAGGLAGHRSLSDREHQVLCLLAAGQEPGAIAGQLCMSVKTVSTYRSRILDKLGLENTAQLIRYALEHKLVPFSEPKPEQ